jgi:predicted 3-demethylubiquinone-9 3-methyltransferase (glyoxalase superfamily)
LREAAVELSCTKKINPFWWFDSEAEEVAKFYVRIFKNSKIGNMRRSDKLGKLNENELVIWKSGDASR